MSFLPISPCCLKGKTLPGEPRGILEPPTSTRTIGRYVVEPSDGNLKAKDKAVLLFYDVFGIQIPNPKVVADTLADQLGLKVFVPDFIANPVPEQYLDSVFMSYPDEFKDRSWPSTIYLWMSNIIKALPYMSFFWGMNYRAEKAALEIQAEGYTDLGAIGYCAGGTCIIHMLASSKNPLSCGVIAHPGPEGKKYYDHFNVPTYWIMASHDVRFKEPQIEEVKKSLEGKDAEFSLKVFPETVHGFAVRPNLEHEPTRKAFDEANADAVAFFKRHLLKE